MEVQFHSFLISTQDRGDWSALNSGHITAGEAPPVPTGQEAGVGPTAGLDVLEKIKISWPCPDSNRG